MTVKFRHIRVVPSPSKSRFPTCTSLLVDDGDTMAVIDPGAGPEALQAAIGERLVDMVINTHWHFDHISGNYLFPETQLWMNPIEAEGFSDLRRVAEWFGVREVYGDSGVTEWIEKVADPNTPQTEFSPCYRHEWWLSTRSPDRTYPYNKEWQIGQARVIMVHAPGHTRGSCCPYFPDEGLVYTADFDLTSSGPACGTDGDFDEFIASARRIAQLDADWFLTGHQAGMFSRSEFRARLDDFLDIINKRQQRLIGLLEAGVKPEDVHKHGLLYPSEYQMDPCIYMWERVGVRKHLELLKATSR